MQTEKTLIQETEKWLKKLESIDIEPLTEKGKEYHTNINAYILDSRHFLKGKDYVRAFEAIIWAWAWAEIGKDLGILEWSKE